MDQSKIAKSGAEQGGTPGTLLKRLRHIVKGAWRHYQENMKKCVITLIFPDYTDSNNVWFLESPGNPYRPT